MAFVAWLGCLLLLSNVFVIQAQYSGGMGSSGYPGYGPSPCPIIVKSSSDDGMKQLLPILLLMLCDNGGFGGFGGGNGGGCGGGGGCGNGCNCGCQNIPIPYPIPIPINNQIIT